MNEYKRLTPCIFIKNRQAVAWFDGEPLDDDVVALATRYSDNGADELLVFDLSDSDREHNEAIDLIRRICRNVRVPVIAGGNIRRLEDVKKFLYAGVTRAALNLSRPYSAELLKEAALRFGKEKLAVSLQDFDQLFKQRELIAECSDEIVFMHRLDLNSLTVTTDNIVTVLTDTMEESEILRILSSPAVNGISGKFISRPPMDFNAFKETCEREGIRMAALESRMEFSEFKLGADGLLPVVVQDYRTDEVLMVAYMNEKAFADTVRTGRMNYYSRSRKAQWLKGETSGHFQYVRSLTIDCDKDTLLAKVEQIGAACHTGNRSCFFQPVVGEQNSPIAPRNIFQSLYDTVADRKAHPKEGSYTNYLFDKGLDKILKKVGEEATELVIAAKNKDSEEIRYEAADLLYHMVVLMVERGVTWDDIIAELANR